MNEAWIPSPPCRGSPPVFRPLLHPRCGPSTHLHAGRGQQRPPAARPALAEGPCWHLSPPGRRGRDARASVYFRGGACSWLRGAGRLQEVPGRVRPGLRQHHLQAAVPACLRGEARHPRGSPTPHSRPGAGGVVRRQRLGGHPAREGRPGAHAPWPGRRSAAPGAWRRLAGHKVYPSLLRTQAPPPPHVVFLGRGSSGLLSCDPPLFQATGAVLVYSLAGAGPQAAPPLDIPRLPLPSAD